MARKATRLWHGEYSRPGDLSDAQDAFFRAIKEHAPAGVQSLSSARSVGFSIGVEIEGA
jgi:hypothetical protein